MTSTDGSTDDFFMARPDMRRALRRFGLLVALLLTSTMAACQSPNEPVAVGIVGYNHTDTVIAQFQINGGSGGSYVDPHRGGGKITCCATVPAQWREGLKATIRWTPDLKAYHEEEVSIPRYEEAGTLQVHFLRNGQIKIFSSSLRLGHPDYPLTGPEAGLHEGEDPVRKDLLEMKRRGQL